MSGRPVVLLSEHSRSAYGALLEQASPGSVLVTVPEAETDPDLRDMLTVGWATADQYAEGALPRFYASLLAAPRLVWLQLPGAGSDDGDVIALQERGIEIVRGPDSGPVIAEFVLRNVLDHFEEAGAWREAQRARVWSRHDFHEVRGSSWLVIGFGRIGRATTSLATALGAAVTVCRRKVSAADDHVRQVTLEDLAQVLPESDVVVICVPATEETYHLVSHDFLASMKDGSLLINVSRGSVLDESALLQGLDSGRPGHAALDVTAAEPLPRDSPLWRHQSVTLTPHNAAASVARYGRAARAFADRLGAYAKSMGAIR